MTVAIVPPAIRLTPAVVLSDRVAVAGDCWLWTGAIDHKGYGRCHVGPVYRAAHRVVYEALVGMIPVGHQLDHLCRVRRCVNPTHLEPVTNAVNSRRGTNTRLTLAQVADIRGSRESQLVVARRFGVSRQLVGDIRRGVKWAAA